MLIKYICSINNTFDYAAVVVSGKVDSLLRGKEWQVGELTHAYNFNVLPPFGTPRQSANKTKICVYNTRELPIILLWNKVLTQFSSG